MKSDLIVRALKIAAARDDLLAARARRSRAKDAYRDACRRASITGGDFEWYPKFELEDGYDDSYVFTRRCQKAYPDLIQGESCHWHHDFIAWYAAGKEKYEANKAHGIALRRLLQIGVKP